MTKEENKRLRIVLRHSIVAHVAPLGGGGGTSAPGSWQTRILDTAVDDNLSILKAGNKMELEAGSYEAQGFAQSTGSYHQARLYNETSAKEVVLGSSGEGISIINGSFTISTRSTLSLQSRVDVGVASEGYGKANPFGKGVFTSMKIRLIGV